MGLFAKIRNWWRGNPSAQARPDAYEPPHGSEVLLVAAKGDVFDLHLMPYFRWESEPPYMSYETLAERSKQYVEPARGRLLREVWDTARGFGPSQLAEAEKKINQLAPVRDGWCYNDRAGVIRCRPSVRVVLDPRLREHMLKHTLAHVDLEELSRQRESRADSARRLTEKWLGVIADLESGKSGTPLTKAERQFLVPSAAVLADLDFANVMREVANQRRAKANELVDVLQEASRNHEGIGLFEFAQAYDQAAQAYAQQLGLGPYRWNLSDMNGSANAGANAGAE
jgi:hypothetical protein